MQAQQERGSAGQQQRGTADGKGGAVALHAIAQTADSLMVIDLAVDRTEDDGAERWRG